MLKCTLIYINKFVFLSHEFGSFMYRIFCSLLPIRYQKKKTYTQFGEHDHFYRSDCQLKSSLIFNLTYYKL